MILQKGWSLIELLMVLIIMGILTGIAIPTYTEYVTQTRRSDGQIALVNAAAAQQRWYSVNFKYTNEINNVGGALSAEGFYQLSVIATNTTFTLTATAIGAQANDSGCTVLMLDHLGHQTPAACW